MLNPLIQDHSSDTLHQTYCVLDFLEIMGRFLMNVMVAASGCPWLVIPVEKRDDYMAALESASVEQDIVPFTKFLASLMVCATTE